MEEAPTPDPFLVHLDEDMVNCLLSPTMIGDLGGRALMRRYPELPQLLADLEEACGLTLRDVATLSKCWQNRPLLGREFVLRPARLHAFMALAMALWRSPLRKTFFLEFLDEVDGPETALPDEAAEWVFGLMEDNEERRWTDFPADFEPSPAFLAHYLRSADATPTIDEERAFVLGLPDVVSRTSEDLHWRRVAVERVIGQAGELLRTIGEAERIVLAPDNPGTDEADADAELHDYYHGACVELTVTPLVRGVWGVALLSARHWHFYATLPFARAACRLRWLRRQEAVEALRQRISGIEYADQTNLETGEKCEFSLAELLTLYQSLESLALVAINDLLPTLAALRTQPAPSGRGESFLEVSALLHQLLDVSAPLGQAFYRSVPAFAQFLEDYLTQEDDREELAKARAEIAALAELTTAGG